MRDFWGGSSPTSASMLIACRLLMCRRLTPTPQPSGDRALAKHPDTIAALGRAVVEGLIEGGALPVIKHMPGLGRALCDSHHRIAACRGVERRSA